MRGESHAGLSACFVLNSWNQMLEARVGIEPTNTGLADPRELSSPHSSRSAATGSIRVARRAGK
jgi:hypothetical protein